VNEFHIVLPSLVIISILIGLHYGYNIVISTQPIERDIQIPESATRKLVEQHAHEQHRVGNISYLTTGTTLYFFEYGCEPDIRSFGPGGPSCLHFGFDEPGKVELEIPKYLIDEFPSIDEVYHDLPDSIFGKQIPFQVINEEDNPYVTVRIDVPSNQTEFKVDVGREKYWLIPASSFLLFWLFFILYVVSKLLAVIIMKKLRKQ
jgi:hypothetical protein